MLVDTTSAALLTTVNDATIGSHAYRFLSLPFDLSKGFLTAYLELTMPTTWAGTPADNAYSPMVVYTGGLVGAGAPFLTTLLKKKNNLSTMRPGLSVANGETQFAGEAVPAALMRLGIAIKPTEAMLVANGKAAMTVKLLGQVTFTDIGFFGYDLSPVPQRKIRLWGTCLTEDELRTVTT